MATGTIDVFDHYAHEDDYPDLDADGAVARLARAIACRTIYTTPEETDFSPFDALLELIRTSYPHVMAAGTLELVGHSILIGIPGSDPTLEAAQLMAHQDVVPVVPGTESLWEHGAFEGFVDDEYVWGRGALDIKDMLMGELEAVDYLLAHHGRPRRGIYLAFGEDEEVTSRGATRLASEMERRGIRLAWLLDEGTTTMFDGAAYGAPSTTISDICISQKGYLSVRLSAHGEGGHSSNPFGGTSLERLACALADVARSKPAPQLTPIVRDTFRTLARHITEEPFRSLVTDVDANAAAIADAASRVRELYPFVCTTVAIDQLEGGSDAPNVMPGDVSATINLRLLPGTSVEEAFELVRDAVRDPEVGVELVHTTPAGRVDTTSGAGYAELQAAFEHYYPDVVVVPSFVCGGTDALRYESICDSVLRISPFRPQPEDEATGVHGTNERILRRTYAQGIRVLISLLESTVL